MVWFTHASILAGILVKLAILSRAPQAYSTQRLKAAAEDRGHRALVLNTLRFAIDLTEGEPDLRYRGKQLSDYDAVLRRFQVSEGLATVDWSTQVLERLRDGQALKGRDRLYDALRLRGFHFRDVAGSDARRQG